MRVLVTRAEKAGQKTATHLLGLGHQPVLLPLAKPHHAPQNALAAFNQPHSALIVTSAEAIRALEGIKDHLHPHFSTPLFAVGSATAKAAQRLGFQQVSTADGDGVALAALLRQRKTTSQFPPLYLAGHPRAKALERALETHALPCIIGEVYRMETIAYAPDTLLKQLGGTPLDTVLLYSAETAKRFCALPFHAEMLELFTSTRFLCLSQHVADHVSPPFNERLFIADHPDEESLLRLL